MEAKGTLNDQLKACTEPSTRLEKWRDTCAVDVFFETFG